MRFIVLSNRAHCYHVCNVNTTKDISIGWLRQALGSVWLIDEMGAEHYAALLEEIRANNFEIKAGMFDQVELPYRANAKNEKTPNGPVMVLPIDGIIMKSDFCGDMGSDSKAALLQRAYAEASIQAIVLKINSPGGSIAGTENFANTVKNAPKPVVTWAEMMASAAYWIGSGSKKVIIGGETAMVGSIGTMATLSDNSAAEEKRGSKKVTVFASRSIHKNKSAQDALQGKPEGYIQEFLDPINLAFENTVTANRSGKIDLKKEDVMTGKVYIGSAAIRAGLADEIGTLDYAIKKSLQIANTF